MNVVVIAASTPLVDLETGEKSNQCRYFEMKVLPDQKSDAIDETIQNNFADVSIVFTDKSTRYVNISDFVDVRMTEKSDNHTTKTTLRWVHLAISNAKKTSPGVFHKIKGKIFTVLFG